MSGTERNLYGLVGYPLTHSFSPAYFKKKFAAEHIDAEYKGFPLAEITDLPWLLRGYPQLRGLNVTIPYKESVIPYLHDMDDAAEEIGAVNCILITEGRLTGYNTDAIAFEQSLRPLLQPHHRQALVLGTGGAAKAITYMLGQLNIPYELVSRTGKGDAMTYEELPELIAQHTLIINTTPLGTHPDVGGSPPIPYELLTERHLLYDLVYNPEQTQFMQRGSERGATVKNGMQMLELQAEESWRVWSGR